MTDYLEELGKKQHENILHRDNQSVIQLEELDLSFKDKTRRAIPFHLQVSGRC